MTIRSISSTAPGLGFGRPRPGAPGARRPAGSDPSALSALTWSDREIIGTMFGADVLTTGRDGQGEPVGVPAFAWLVIEDRRSGRLPGGSEITSSYLQAIRDSEGFTLFTATALDAALDLLGQRKQGATVDLRA
jgi:hypothetical protein